MPEWLFPVLTAVCVGGGGAYLAFLYNQGREEQWRRQIDLRVERLETASERGDELRQANAVKLQEMSGQLLYLLRTVGEDGKHGLRGDLHALRGEWTPILIRIQDQLERHK